MDEPTAGLDPAGREEILGLMDQWHRQGRTIIWSQAMDDRSAFCPAGIRIDERENSSLRGYDGAGFAQDALLERIGLGLPRAARLARSLRQAGFRNSRYLLYDGRIGADGCRRA
jgi:energy-coupling factor transport system ATP-binding protein